MKTIHLLIGNEAKANLQSIFKDIENIEIICFEDQLNIGPLKKTDNKSFAEIRNEFWTEVLETESVAKNDIEVLLEISKRLHQKEVQDVVIWIAANAKDICAYYWIIFYLGHYPSQIKIINIAGLPFLNDNNSLYFPKEISELNTKEIQKALKLSRYLSPSEIETDRYEWQQMVNTNAKIRLFEGGKKIAAKDDTFFDSTLISFCTDSFQKKSKIISAAQTKENKLQVDNLFLTWRLRILVQEGNLEINETNSKTNKEFDIRLKKEELSINPI